MTFNVRNEQFILGLQKCHTLNSLLFSTLLFFLNDIQCFPKRISYHKGNVIILVVGFFHYTFIMATDASHCFERKRFCYKLCFQSHQMGKNNIIVEKLDYRFKRNAAFPLFYQKQ